MKKSKKRLNINKMEDIPMTPMIDVVFQLLIYFVFTFEIVDIDTHIQVSRPAPSKAPPPPEKPNLHKIVVAHDGWYYMNGARMDLEKVEIVLGGHCRHRSNPDHYPHVPRQKRALPPRETAEPLRQVESEQSQRDIAVNFLFETEMMVRDYECDLQGIVNNAVYQHYLEHARHEFLHHIGLEFAELCAKGIDAVVTRIELDYKRSLRPRDVFVVKVGMHKQGRLRFVFDQAIYRKSDQALILEGKVIGVLNLDGCR